MSERSRQLDAGQPGDAASASHATDGSGTESIATGQRARHIGLFVLLIAITVGGVLLSLSWSSVSIPVDQVLTILFGGEADRSTWRVIVMDIRLPRILTGMAVGVGLGLAGLQIQTVFRNPLASPFTLGISSGGSLGVALVILVGPATLFFGATGGGVLNNLGVVMGAALGSAGVMGLMLLIASRVQDMVIVLLLGVVIGALVSAVVTILIFFADEQRTREFVEWGLGSFNRVRWDEMPFFTAAIGFGLMLAAFRMKQLNALLLGENYARSMGLNVRTARITILASASVMAGAVVAYAGPISFLGIAVPHIARGIFGTSDHRILVPGTLLSGAIIGLACGLLAEMPNSNLNLPINAATALFGAPVAI